MIFVSISELKTTVSTGYVESSAASPNVMFPSNVTFPVAYIFPVTFRSLKISNVPVPFGTNSISLLDL